MNRWWEISIQADQSQEESIGWRLEQLGCTQFASEMQSDGTNYLRAYVPIERLPFLDIAALSLQLKYDAQLLHLPAPHCRSRILQEEDWSNNWKQHWQPQEIGDSLMVYPAWIAPPTGELRHIIYLDPGSAFGTGTHPTTQMSLEAIEMRLTGVRPQDPIQFADIGCGSGILAIGALLLGAETAYAVDNDILAVKATHHNRQLNHIPDDRLWVAEGDLHTLLAHLDAPVDGFACNILLEPILAMIPLFEQLVKPTGWGVLSGILVDQVPQVMESLNNHKWSVATLWKRKSWCCLTIRREP
jgi:ribosomal protein L11 methyltransferase